MDNEDKFYKYFRYLNKKKLNRREYILINTLLFLEYNYRNILEQSESHNASKLRILSLFNIPVELGNKTRTPELVSLDHI